jgi:Domain of unknown function (DUF4384)
MTHLKPKPLRRLLAPFAIGIALAGCSALDAKKPTVEQTNAIKKAPESPPHRSITNFSDALRCMDNTFIDYGVRDVSVLVEDLHDTTKKVNAGTQDMLISAVSDMTKRSRALRLVAFGHESNNLIAFLQQAERKSAYAAVPQFDIKGSITQLDENLIRNQKDLGVSVNPYINLGVARDAASNMIALDLTMLSTNDLSIVPGVTSRNSVIIFKEGKGYDGDAAIRKFGISYNMNLSKSEGQSQALRNLVELAVIELFGKLTKTPYWTCLGADANDDSIRGEISDWYYAMQANSRELNAYFQNQLRVRQHYNGPVDGEPRPELDMAVAKYRKALGLSEEPKLDLDFFSAYLKANHKDVLAKSPPAPLPPFKPSAQAAIAQPQAVAAAPIEKIEAAPQAKKPDAPPTQAAPQSQVQAKAAPKAPANSQTLPLILTVAPLGNANKHKPGELVNLVVRPNRNAHVYCYLLDEEQKIQRFFPNRFAKDSLVSSTAPLQLPGNMKFQIVANAQAAKETVACFATERDVMAELPASVTGTDFEALPVASINEVKSIFAAVSRGALGEDYYHVEFE